MKRSTLFAVTLVTVVAAITAFAQQNPPDNPLPEPAVTAPALPAVEVIGKRGWLTLNADTKLGATALTPGTYYLQHEMKGGSHVVSFPQVGDPDLALQYSDEGTVGSPVTTQCRLESLPTRVKRSTITTVPDGKIRRVTRIEIKGENVAHLL